MTMLEKQMNSIKKEIEKLEKSLATHQTRLEKKIANAEKANANWTVEEFENHRDTDMTQPQWAAYFELYSERMDVKDIKERLANAHKRLDKISPKVETKLQEIETENELTEKINHIESHWISKEEKKQQYEAWLKKFKAECLKDGIIIDEADANFVNGTTPNGKRFVIYINNGWTERSRYCYTLMINGDCLFTSGTFHKAYSYLMKN